MIGEIKKPILCIAVLGFTLLVCAGGNIYANGVGLSIGSETEEGNPFVKSYDGWSIRPFMEVPLLILDFEHDNKSLEDISYVPNITLTGGVAITYKNIMLSFHSDLPFTAQDEGDFGRTRAKAFKFAAFFGRWK